MNERRKKISELRKAIKKQAQFVSIASMENPLNMGADQTKLYNMRDELESILQEKPDAVF